METIGGFHKEDDEQMDLPPGFRFHPTDEEIITHYLHKKVLDKDFSAKAIGEVDLNKAEPWELPCSMSMAVSMLRNFNEPRSSLQDASLRGFSSS
ncbi:hypothetical protein Bca52824_069884 [Brassica carinata]|uniref:NAC domain-containing protein n=1 Tax=Brassica carinata TaxID=52824 RepID=A0A8X7Q3E0_BRACI|nr:hypothetical protein Bca52824_069884 [Brassica carinata]